jgi:hypothetical protein
LLLLLITVLLLCRCWYFFQVDLQAQARAHRIGQKKDVLVLRFETVSTICSELLFVIIEIDYLGYISSQCGTLNSICTLDIWFQVLQAIAFKIIHHI